VEKSGRPDESALSGNETTLRRLAKRFGGRVSDCVVYDANVCATTSPPGKPWKLVCISGSPLAKSVKGKHRDRKIRMHANETYVVVEVRGPYKLGLLAINLPNRIQFMSTAGTELNVAGRNIPTFVRTGGASPAQVEALRSDGIARVLEIAELGDGEGVHFYDDAAMAYLRCPSADRIAAIIEGLVDCAPATAEQADEADFDKLPARFHSLIPLVSKWSIADDDARENLLAHSPKRALKQLVEQVEPYLVSIDAYLDSCGKTPPPEACALGTLTECALEAKAVLEKR